MVKDEDRDLAELRRQLTLVFARVEDRIEERNAGWHRRRARRRVRLAAVAMVMAALLGGATAVVIRRDRPATSPVVQADVAPVDVAAVGPPAGPAVTPASPDEAAVLRAALDEWIAATNERDFTRQMAFYPAQLSAFYLARRVPREAVLAEKQRVFARADVIDIRTADPEITLAADGATAVMRFRKRYVITGPRIDRRGEVVQELRWVRADGGWRIDSERDIRVLRSRPGRSAG